MTVFVLVAGLIAAVASVFVAVDVWFGAREWLGRIHIGRYSGREEWRRAVAGRAMRWLHRTPTVPRRADGRLILIDMLRRRRRSDTIQSWQVAGLVLGLSRTHGCRIESAMLRRLAARYGSTPAVDRALLAYALMEASPADGRDGAIDEFARSTRALLDDVRGTQATIPYRKGSPDVRYVDTLGFVCPFLFLYAERFGDDEAARLAERQLREYAAVLHPSMQLPPHAFDLAAGNALGAYDWGRGVGWYILALVESWRVLGASSAAAVPNIRGRIESRITDLAARMLPCQRGDGGYAVFINDPGAPVDSSATALCAMLMQSAAVITGDGRYKASAGRCVGRLMASTRRDGAVDFCQGDTMGIGFYSSSFSLMPFVQGIALTL